MRKVLAYLLVALLAAFMASEGLRAASLLKQAAARMARNRAEAQAEVLR